MEENFILYFIGVNILLWKRKEELAEIQEAMVKKFSSEGQRSSGGSRSNRRPRSGEDDLKKRRSKQKDTQTKEKVKVKTKTKK